MQINNENIYILDKLISKEELFWIYHALLETNGWNLSRTTEIEKKALKPFTSFPGLNVETQGESNQLFLSGYFNGLIFRIRQRVKDEFKLILPDLVYRIHIGAKSSLSKTNLHIDSHNKDDWTIIGFLNPIWNKINGGEIYVNKSKIEYKPSRFIIFPSHFEHDGGFVKNEDLNYWRISLNIILTQKF